MTRAEEIAWAAGLFEGEGCVSLQVRDESYRAPILVLSMADEEIVRRFHRIVGCGRVNKSKSKRPSHHKDQWDWRAQARKEVIHVMAILRPGLGSRRRNRIAEVLAAATPFRGYGAKELEKTHCPQGHPYDEKNTYKYRGGRVCRTCRNDRGRELRRRRKLAKENL